MNFKLTYFRLRSIAIFAHPIRIACCCENVQKLVLIQIQRRTNTHARSVRYIQMQFRQR